MTTPLSPEDEVADQKRAVVSLLAAINGWRHEPCGELLEAVVDISKRRDAGLILVECGRLTLECLEAVLLGSGITISDVLQRLGLDLASS